MMLKKISEGWPRTERESERRKRGDGGEECWHMLACCNAV